MIVRQLWIDILNKVATGASKTRTLLTPIGILIFGAFTTVFVLAAIVVDRQLQLPCLLSESVSLVVAMKEDRKKQIAVFRFGVIHEFVGGLGELTI